MLKRFLHTFLAAASALVLASATLAQAPAATPDITINTPVNSKLLQQWLDSGDPRLVAWAGYFARTTGDAATLDTISRKLSLLLSDAMPAVTSLTIPYAEESLLDSLIERKVTPKQDWLWTVQDSFPAQALLLALNLPPAQRQQQLLHWTGLEGFPFPGKPHPELAEIAASILAKDPPPGFVARMLDSVEQTNTITVTRVGGPAAQSEGSFGGGCGDSFGQPRPEDWPPIFAYQLTAYEGKPDGPVLATLGDKTFTFYRHSAFEGSGSCQGVYPLNPYLRREIIAGWLHTAPDALQWNLRAETTIEWCGEDAYLLALGRAIDRQRAQFHDIAARLEAAHLLTREEVNKATPNISVQIHCTADPCPLK